MIANQFIAEGHPKKLVLDTVDIARSSYYYRPKQAVSKQGAPASEYTFFLSGKKVSNQTVVEQIIEVLSEEFVDYGYLKVTHYLRQTFNYRINPKKVYRLMRENQLLNKVKARKKSKRNWVKNLLPDTKEAFDYLEFDIKYVYIAGLNRNALLLTIIDVNTRWVMAHVLMWQLKHQQVIELFDQVFEVYPLPKHFYVRNDNGSQFEAKAVQLYFQQKRITQEFCKPATPEQNAHIESYHSIVEKVVCQRYEFETLKECQNTFNRFVKFYNNKRIHSGVGYQSPRQYLDKEHNIKINEKQLQKTLDCKSLELLKS